MLDRIDRLSLRQRQVLHLAAHGRTNAEIADELCLSPSTVKTIAWEVLAKLECGAMRQATYAYGFWLGQQQAMTRPAFDELPLADRIAIAAEWLRSEGARAA